MTIKKSAAPKADTIKMEILEDCGTLSTRKGGWELKLRYISWNGGEPKYDLRPWKVNEQGEEVCNKGITLTGEELEALVALVNS